MGFLLSGLLLVGGVLAAANLIISKKPEAADLIKKIAPYQSWIGLGLLGWGIFMFLFRFLFWIKSWTIWLRFVPVWSISYLASIIVMILLGAILSMNFLKQRKELPKEKLEAIEKKIKPFQIPLGVTAVILAVVGLLARIVGF